MALLVQNMERLDENIKEEADGIHNTLGIIENLTDLKPEICATAGEQGLVAWLMKRLRVRVSCIFVHDYCHYYRSFCESL